MMHGNERCPVIAIKETLSRYFLRAICVPYGFLFPMETRRSFLKKAGLLTGAAGMMQVLPASLQRALAINPAPGSTFYDAEHVVFLMQENRSFDHAFGTLQGVRGFNDPRAIQLPDGRPV